jgi:glucose/arabinose dehydrogenase
MAQTRCLLVVLIAAALHAPIAVAQPSVVPPLQLNTLVTGLSLPTTMDFVAPDDILVLQKDDGKVRRVLNGTLLPGDVLDVAVNATSERGMLGIAVNTESPPKVFLYFTEAASDGAAAIANRVYRYDWNPALGVLESPLLILDLPVSPGPNHDGGIVMLGPPGEVPGVGDGALLYVVIGDLNRDGQLENHETGAAPDGTAVIFRVQQDGSPAPGNPFAPYCSTTTSQTCSVDDDCPGAEVCETQVEQYFAYGVRNSFGLALDPVTGALWDTENGPNINDEVNLVAPGFNSGWEDVMGLVVSPTGLFDMPGAGNTYSPPEFTWTNTIAPTAILFPFGSALGASFDDSVLIADSNLGQIYEFPLNVSRDGFDLAAPLDDLIADTSAETDLLAIGDGFFVITDLDLGPDGLVYVLSLGTGSIYTLPEPGAGGFWAGTIVVALLSRARNRHRPSMATSQRA